MNKLARFNSYQISVSILFLLGALVLAPPASAEISGNFGQGAVKIGPATDTCNNASEGSIRWNTIDKVHEFCNGASWTRVVPDCSAWPDDFSFPATTNASAGNLQTSSIEMITGISCSNADVSITGHGNPYFRICSDASCNTVVQNWRNTTTALSNSQYLQLRLTASATSLGVYTATVTVGGQARNWSVTTEDLGTFKYTFGIGTGANVGGIAGADTMCANAASGAGLGGTYMAWLATGAADDPDSRFITKATVPYRGTDSALVATNWTDLTDGSVSVNPARKDASGNWNAAGWIISNVDTDGTAAYDGTNNCSGWTTNGTGYTNHYGQSNQTNSNWTDAGTGNCSGYRILLCIQQ